MAQEWVQGNAQADTAPRNRGKERNEAMIASMQPKDTPVKDHGMLGQGGTTQPKPVSTTKEPDPTAIGPEGYDTGA